MQAARTRKIFHEVPGVMKPDSVYTYKTLPTARVPKETLTLWYKRGFCPLPLGVALVKFENQNKEYVFPLYFMTDE